MKLQAKNLILRLVKQQKEFHMDCALDISDLLLIPDFLSEQSKQIMSRVASNVFSSGEASTQPGETQRGILTDRLSPIHH
jgi:hypothetical protein